jgi:hypothetical protein
MNKALKVLVKVACTIEISTCLKSVHELGNTTLYMSLNAPVGLNWAFIVSKAAVLSFLYAVNAIVHWVGSPATLRAVFATQAM